MEKGTSLTRGYKSQHPSVDLFLQNRATGHSKRLSMRLILDSKIDVDQRGNRKKRTALMLASVHGHTTLSRFLLKQNTWAGFMQSTGVLCIVSSSRVAGDMSVTCKFSLYYAAGFIEAQYKHQCTPYRQPNTPIFRRATKGLLNIVSLFLYV